MQPRIKLTAIAKNVIKEFDIISSKLRQEDSSTLYYSYVEEAIPRKLNRDIVDVCDYFVDDSTKYKDSPRVEDDPLPKVLQQKLIASGKIIGKSGTRIIVLYSGSGVDGNNYILFDFSKPANKFKFVVGVMWTTTYESSLNFSPKKTLDLPRLERIHYTHLDKSYIGQGYGKFLYDTCLNYIGAAISDSTLFNESFGMWTNHIKRTAKFFGIMVSYDTDIPSYMETGGGDPHAKDLKLNRIIIPVAASQDITKKDIKRLNGGNGFIAIFNKVPAVIQKMSAVFANTPFEDIMVAVANGDFSAKIEDAFEDAETTDELLYNFNNIGVGIKDIVGLDNTDVTVIAWLFNNATVVTTQTTDDLEYIII